METITRYGLVSNVSSFGPILLCGVELLLDNRLVISTLRSVTVYENVGHFEAFRL